MSTISLETLGITKDEIEDRVVETVARALLSSVACDEDGDEVRIPSGLKRKLDAKIEDAVDKAIDTLAKARVEPMLAGHVEALVLQQTNQWGEKVGKPVTFVEYLVGRAEAWMTEKVDHNGKTKAESGGYSWSGNTTRVAFLIDSHLQFQISSAMKRALADANTTFAKGLNDAVKVALGQVVQSIKVEVKTR